MTKAQIPRQLFRISSELIDSVAKETVDHICADLQTLGMFKLPYPKIDVEFPIEKFVIMGHTCMAVLIKKEIPPETDQVIKIYPDTYMRYTGLSIQGADSVTIELYKPTYRCRKTIPLDEQMLQDGFGQAWNVVQLLVAVLATRNVVKQTTHNKLARLGIGHRSDRYEYTTRLLPPTDAPEATGEGAPTEGRPKCPHLRRGHIRNQRHGPNYEFVKQIWIEPIFVNADREWTKTRTGYNFSLGHRPMSHPGVHKEAH